MSRNLLLTLVSLMYGCAFEVYRTDDEPCSECTPPANDADTDTDADSDTAADNGSDGDDDDDVPSDTSEGSIDIDGDGYALMNSEGVAIDCNDADASVNPGELDDTCDGVDQDCDGVDGNDFVGMMASACGGTDADGDGYFDQNQSGEVIDCDDSDATVNPGASEILDNEVDENCDGAIEVTSTENDVDGDGYESDVDCDDNDSTVNPGASEVPYDGMDQDCDNVDLGDVDCDGYGKYAVDGSVLDCDDSDASVNPAATEVLDNEVDENCDGIVEVTTTENDVDGDGYESDVDCDDGDSAINPGASEVCDSVDNDCDGSIDEGVTTRVYLDRDGDGYGDELSGTDTCGVPSGYVTVVNDCNDEDASIYTGATESFDEVDNDCDSEIDEDWQIVAEVTYGSSGYYVLNAQVFNDVDELGSAWDPEIDTESSGTTIVIEYTTAEYGDLSASCGIRLNVSEGNPATDWLCSGSAIDTAAASVDVWFSGTWYNESDFVVWDAGLGNGSCSALLLVSTTTDCQP